MILIFVFIYLTKKTGSQGCVGMPIFAIIRIYLTAGRSKIDGNMSFLGLHWQMKLFLLKAWHLKLIRR